MSVVDILSHYIIVWKEYNLLNSKQMELQQND